MSTEYIVQIHVTLGPVSLTIILLMNEHANLYDDVYRVI